jgi:hypothetical protein
LAGLRCTAMVQKLGKKTFEETSVQNPKTLITLSVSMMASKLRQ